MKPKSITPKFMSSCNNDLFSAHHWEGSNVRRCKAQVQAQVQVQQGASQQQQPNHAQLQNQVQNQIGMNGQIGQITAQFAPHPNVAAASNTQHSSPPNVNATAAANFPRPASSQQRPNNVPISGAQVLPLGGGTVPIARTNTSALSAYFNTNGAQLTPEQQINVVRMFVSFVSFT